MRKGRIDSVYQAFSSSNIGGRAALKHSSPAVTAIPKDDGMCYDWLIFTPLSSRQAASIMKIVIGSDHGGFDLKVEIIAHLTELGHTAIDFGTHGTAPVDYPDFAFLVAAAVARGEFPLGIIVDGAGIGSSIVANKVPGIRASLCNDLFAARNAREHNHANILTLGSRVIGSGLAKEIVKTWLSTTPDPRHARRIEKIQELETQLYRLNS